MSMRCTTIEAVQQSGGGTVGLTEEILTIKKHKCKFERITDELTGQDGSLKTV